MSKRLVVLALAGFVSITFRAAAQTAPSLGKAWNYAVLGRSVVNSGDTLITGDLGFTDSNNVAKERVRLGTIASKSAAQQALSDAAAALNQSCVGQPPVQCFDVGAIPLTLTGNPDTVWIIHVNGDLTTLPKTAVRIIGGGHDWNVFWFVHGKVSLGAGTVFVGSIVASGAITLDSGAYVAGRVIALGGAVTLNASSVSVCCPQITISSDLPRGNVGEQYTQTLTALPSLPKPQSYQFELLDGSLPPGLSRPVNGVISGTLKEAGTFPFTIIATMATDTYRCAGVQPEAINVCPLTLSPLTPPRGKVGQQYGTPPITVIGGSGSYLCNVSGLPDGINFCPGMTFQGVPKKCGKYKVVVEITDQITGCTVKQEYELVICGVALTPGPLPDGTVCEPYTPTPLDPGCVIGDVTFQIISGALPNGLSLSTKGIISGRPTAAGNSKLMVRATDAEGCFDEKPYAITIRPATTIPVLPETLSCGTVGVDYTEPITATGCIGKCTFTADPAGSLPPGVGLDRNSGVLSGKPTTPGCYSFRVWVIDPDCPERTGYRDYTVCICGNLAFVQSSPLPTATFQVPYRLTLQVTGGKGPYRFQIRNRPRWLNLSPSGVLSGTPVNVDAVTAMIHGPFPCFTVTATDSMGCCPPVESEFCLPVRVCDDPITINTTSLPNGTKGQEYTVGIEVAGGAPSVVPVPLTVVSGSLPPGLTLNGQILSGVPSSTGTFCFGLVATDIGKCSSPPQDYTIVIADPACANGPTIILSPAVLPQPAAGVPYFQQLTAVGGLAPYTFSVSTGALPDGLQLDPISGVIFGTPKTSGLYEFTIIAMDKNGCVSTRCEETIIVP